MKVIEGGLRPGEQPKDRPGTEPWILPSFTLTLAADGQIVMTVAKRPLFGDPSTSKRHEFQLMPGEKLSRVVTYKNAEYTVTIERKPSDTINLTQAKRAKKVQP